MITSDRTVLEACVELSRDSGGCTVHDLGDFLCIPNADAEVALVRLKRRGLFLRARMHSRQDTRPHYVYYLTQRGMEQVQPPGPCRV